MLQVSSGVEGCVLETLWWSGDSLLENTQGKGREGEGERGAGVESLKKSLGMKDGMDVNVFMG